MCPPAASPANDIGLYCSDKDIFMSLEGYIGGNPLPSNVISDVNPYEYQPSDLPDGIWFLIKSKAKKDADFGYWRTKGEACQIFSSSFVSGWRSTLEFFEGQAPHGNKTGWVMQEYWITRKILSKDNNEKEINFLCNVFFVGEKNPNHLKPYESTEVNTASLPTQLVAQEALNDPGANSKPQMHEDDGPRSSVIIRERANDNRVDIVPEVNYLSGDDFLELLDLEIPPSPSSSSDWSCVTMSSDECFDALELFQDLVPEKVNDPMRNNPGFKLSVHASSRPTEMVAYPPTIGTLGKLPGEEVPENGKSMPEPLISRNISDKKVMNNPSRNQKPGSGSGSGNGNEGIASTSRNQVVRKEDSKAARGRTKRLKMKYLCFMPFLY